MHCSPRNVRYRHAFRAFPGRRRVLWRSSSCGAASAPIQGGDRDMCAPRRGNDEMHLQPADSGLPLPPSSRPQPELHQEAAVIDSFGLVDAQKLNGGDADGCFATQYGAFPNEMIVPRAGPRIEKGHHRVGTRRVAGDVGAFVDVAPRAGPAKVFGRRWAAMFLGADMVCFVRQYGATLRHAAILAAILRPLPNFATQLVIHGEFAPFRRLTRAFACNRSRNWPTRK